MGKIIRRNHVETKETSTSTSTVLRPSGRTEHAESWGSHVTGVLHNKLNPVNTRDFPYNDYSFVTGCVFHLKESV